MYTSTDFFKFLTAEDAGPMPEQSPELGPDLMPGGMETPIDDATRIEGLRTRLQVLIDEWTKSRDRAKPLLSSKKGR